MKPLPKPEYKNGIIMFKLRDSIIDLNSKYWKTEQFNNRMNEQPKDQATEQPKNRLTEQPTDIKE